MFAFGLGTVPNMLALELTATRMRRAAVQGRRWLRPAIGVALILFASSDLAHAARVAGWQSPPLGWLSSICHG
jgi:sulfite exporter TauE/SafE